MGGNTQNYAKTQKLTIWYNRHSPLKLALIASGDNIVIAKSEFNNEIVTGIEIIASTIYGTTRKLRIYV